MEFRLNSCSGFKTGDLVDVKYDGGAGTWGRKVKILGFVYQSSSILGSKYFAVVQYATGNKASHDFVVTLDRLIPSTRYEYRTVTCAKDYRHALDEGWVYDCDKGNDVQLKRKVK